MTNSPLLVIVMGSKADEPHCRTIARAAQDFGLQVDLRVASAHKTPRHLLEILQQYEVDPRPKVYITVAGRSNALSGFVDGAVSAPVIACPPISEAFGGGDIFSSLRMPSGIAPALVLDPANAALLAAKVLGLVDSQVRSKVVATKEEHAAKILEDDGRFRDGS
jgi:5-(carboxyamino)imidazole ribonucleotide mutase